MSIIALKEEIRRRYERINEFLHRDFPYPITIRIIRKQNMKRAEIRTLQNEIWRLGTESRELRKQVKSLNTQIEILEMNLNLERNGY